MRKRSGVCKVVDAYNLNISIALQKCTKHKTSDASKPVNGNLRGHGFPIR
jgi:hypothetical protein